MYSATLDQARFRSVRRTVPPSLKHSFDKIAQAWKTISSEQIAEYEIHAAPPGRFIEAPGDMIVVVTDFVDEQSTALDRETLRFYFDTVHFRVHQRAFRYPLVLRYFPEPCFRCAAQHRDVPAQQGAASHLRSRFARAHSVALFSATLMPMHFYGDLFGLPETRLRIDLESPFHADQLPVHAIANVSTRYRDRVQSVPSLVDLITTQYRRAPGNYLSFFSSFDYLNRIASVLLREHPDIPMWTQSRSMSEADQQAFLAIYRGRQRYRLRGARWIIRTRHRLDRRAADRRVHRHAGAAATQSREPADESTHGQAIRRRLRPHISLSWRAESGAGCGARDSTIVRSRGALSHRRPVYTRRLTPPAARVVAGGDRPVCPSSASAAPALL